MPENNLYKQIIENADEPITLISPEGKFLLINTAAAGLLGGKPSDYLNKELYKLFPKKIIDEHIGIINNIVKTGVGVVRDTKIPLSDGDHYFHLSAKPIKDESGKVESVLVFSTDISQRKKLEEHLSDAVIELSKTKEELKESKAIQEGIFENVPVACYLNDVQGKLVNCNKKALELLGYSKEELIGKDFLEKGILEEKYLPKMLELLKKNNKGYSTGPDELQFVKKDGTIIYVELITRPRDIKNEKIILGIARDITERKKNEEYVLNAIGNAFHEIKNPLTNIKGYAELLYLTETNETKKGYIQLIIDQVDNANMKANNYLSIEKIEKGRFRVSPKEENLEEIIKHSINSMSYKIELNNAKITYKKIDFKGKSKAKVDRLSIIELLENLFDNALKYGKDKKVLVNLSKQEDEVIINVIGGNGIKKEQLGLLNDFKPQTILERSDVKPSNRNGRGLYICNKIMEAHQGSLEIKLTPEDRTNVELKFKELKD